MKPISLVIAAALLAATVAYAEEPKTSQSTAGSGSGEQQEPQATATVTENLQGKDGVRIQTMCTHCNSSNIQVGGLNKDLAPIFAAGYPLLGGLATSFVFNVLPGDNIVDTDLTKGPGNAGDPAGAAGGTIRLTEASPDEVPFLNVSVEGGSYNLQSGSARLSGSINSKLSGYLIAGTTTADPVDDDRDGWNDVGSLDREYGRGGLFFQANDHNRIDLGLSWIAEDTLEARGGFDALNYFMSNNAGWTREDTLLDRREVRGGWQWKGVEGDRLEVRLLQAIRHQSVHSQLTALSGFGNFDQLLERFRIREQNRWGSVTYSRPIGLSWILRAGIEGSDQIVGADTIDLASPGQSQYGADFVTVWSGHIDLDWTVSSRWSIGYGVRYDDYRWGAKEISFDKADGIASPRLAISYFPTPDWTLRFVAGRTTRAPKPIFTEVCCGQSYQRSFTSDLEVGETYGLEGIYQPSPDLKLSLYTARTDFDDYILKLAGWSQFYIQTYTLGNIPNARAETLEVAGRWSVTPRISLDSSIGWLTFLNQGDPDVTVQVTPPSFQSPQDQVIPIRRIPYQPVRTASLGVAVSLPRRVNLSATGSYTGAMPIQQFDPNPNAGTNLLLPEMRSTDPFWLVNASITVPIGRYLGLTGSINNLTDEIQSDLGDPTTDYNWGPLSGRSYLFGLKYHLDR